MYPSSLDAANQSIDTNRSHYPPSHPNHPFHFLPKQFQFLYLIRSDSNYRVACCRDMITNTEIRVRTISVRKNGHPEEFLKRLKAIIRELRVLKSINHPNIISVIDCIVHDEPNHIYIFILLPMINADLSVMIFGAQLYRVKTGSERSQESTARFLFQLFDGLNSLHSVNLIHCNIKPYNLLFDYKSQSMFITDMGFVQSKRTTKLKVKPALNYCPPEVILEVGRYNGKLDIWAVGCIIYELLTHRLLFQVDTEVDAIHAILNIIPPLSQSDMNFIPNAAHKCYIKTYLQNRSLDAKQTSAADESTANGPQNYMFKTLTECGYTVNDSVVDLMLSCLQFNPSRRISAKHALNHPFFAHFGLRKDSLINQDKVDIINGLKTTDRGKILQALLTEAATIQTEGHSTLLPTIRE